MTYSQLGFLFLFFIVSIKANALEEVNTQALSELIVYQHYQFPAKVVALNEITLSSEMAGIIESKSLLIGSSFKKNQTLIRISCTDTKLAKEQAVAALKRLKVEKLLAQQQLTRTRKLVRAKSISKQELDQRQTALDASIASLEQQQVALKIIDYSMTKCTVKAPFSGIITSNKAMPHEYVTPGAPLLDIMQTNAVEIEANLSLALGQNIKNINTIYFKQGNNTFPLSMRVIMPKVDSQTKQQIIRLNVIGNKKPVANSIGFLEWNGHQANIPSQYIVQRNGQLGLFVAEAGSAVFKPLNKAIEGQISPVNLSPDTLVITNKLLNLKNKDAIK